MANILIVGPHPDDQELGMGATIAKLVSQGHNVLLLDMTDGEPTPRGSPEIRAREAGAAAGILGVKRVQLGLKNRYVEHTIGARHMVAGVIRAHQASIVFAPFPQDAHPDHVATTRIVEDARFDAKLTKLEFPSVPGLREATGRDTATPVYPKWLFYYYASHLRWVADPSFVMDVTGFERKKIEAVEAYHSQFIAPGRVGAQPARADGSGLREMVMNALGYFGTRIGTLAGEPFWSKEPVGLTGLDGLA